MSRLLQSRKEIRRPHARLVLIYLVVLLLGLGMTSGRMPGAFDAGRVTMVVGVGGIAWELVLWQRATRKRLAAQTHARARGELKAARAARRIKEQAQNRQQKQTHLRAVRKRIQMQQAEGQTDQQRLNSLDALRSTRFQVIATEATRLQALPDINFLTEIPTIFAAHGLRPESDLPFSKFSDHSQVSDNDQASGQHSAKSSAWDEESWDMRFTRLADASSIIARCIPQGHTAAVADVEALEQWRRSCEASHAYLIGRAGFSAAAIRLAQHFPMTLIEPQLLAQWHTTNNRDQSA